MKSFICVVFVAQAVIFQLATSQVIRTCGSNILAPTLIAGPQILAAPTVLAAPQCIRACPPVATAPVISAPVISAPVIQSNSVANSLADTLSLLTVSSLLAETLPLPVPVIPAVGCGCGCGATYFI